MAQQDTGMGWSAKSEWLMEGSSYLGTVTVGATIVENAPTFKQSTAPTYAQLTAANYYFNANYEGDNLPVYIGLYQRDGVSPSCAIAAYQGNDGTYIVLMRENAAEGGSTRCYMRWLAPPGNIGGSGNYEPRAYTLNPNTGLYEHTMFMGSNMSVVSSGTIPVFSSAAAREAAYTSVQTSYSKLNQGYAVACFASWYTPEGSHLISPALISTASLATAITTNGATPSESMTTFDFLYDGTRFYMSIIGGIDADNATVTTSAIESAPLEQFAAAAPSKVFSLIASESFSNIIIGTSPDPYQEEGGASEAEGGDGEDLEDDPVEEETLPVPSVAGHGFCTIYVPSAQELGQMSSYLWSGAFDVTQVIKLFSNPMDSILGLSAVPVSLSGTSEQIYLGGVALTGITMPKYTGRTSVKVDFGTTTINERWGSYLDYEPYTEFSIYLPFIGIKPLKADDIMGKTISLMYNIDILSGGCVAYIRAAGGSVLYEWSGQCALQIPVTARNYDNVFQTAMSVVGAVGAAVVAPASAPVLSGAVASAAVQAAATKPRIERSGAVNGITGFLGQLRPYLIRTIPEAFIPADQNKFIGYPAYINVDLARVTGYNEVDSIHLENVTATGAELDEIETILKGGVIF